MATKRKVAKASRSRLQRTLAVDVGGSGIKAEVLSEGGKVLSARTRIATPARATPRKVIAIIVALAKKHASFDRVSVGFPGVVKDGVVYSAPNLGSGWKKCRLAEALGRALRRPVRVANDADIQGLASVSGRGIELVITLGTGLGSAIFVDGHRIHLEIGHHPFRKGRTYEDELGHRTLKRKGKRRWNKRLSEAIGELKRAFGYDRLFIGGGNTKFIRFKLPKDVTVVKNEQGLLGGVALWRRDAAIPPR